MLSVKLQREKNWKRTGFSSTSGILVVGVEERPGRSAVDCAAVEAEPPREAGAAEDLKVRAAFGFVAGGIVFVFPAAAAAAARGRGAEERSLVQFARGHADEISAGCFIRELPDLGERPVRVLESKARLKSTSGILVVGVESEAS